MVKERVWSRVKKKSLSTSPGLTFEVAGFLPLDLTQTSWKRLELSSIGCTGIKKTNLPLEIGRER